ncbi:MAG TPA: type II toxin-antitoxin system VapC family toxin [Thermoplasmata archaeon]|nr:type II toxin-antitoxin system VapC family toxin [Thermoplasmata archaeon]
MPPRYLDASVLVHAYLRPRRELKPHERAIKSHARAIVTRIDKGEPVVTSTVHVAEVANILEDWMNLEDARSIEQGLCTRDSIRILQTAKMDLLEALGLASEFGLGTTDSLAVVFMKREGIREIYSFDKDYDGLPGVTRVSE